MLIGKRHELTCSEKRELGELSANFTPLHHLNEQSFGLDVGNEIL
jgi:hypothetical protein